MLRARLRSKQAGRQCESPDDPQLIICGQPHVQTLVATLAVVSWWCPSSQPSIIHLPFHHASHLPCDSTSSINHAYLEHGTLSTVERAKQMMNVRTGGAGLSTSDSLQNRPFVPAE